MLLFAALALIGVAVGGLTAFVIFWPLTLVHVRDRHPGLQAELGAGAFANPTALRWLLRGGYRRVRDRNLDGLATPAKVSLLVVLGSLLASGALWGLAEVFG
ncbi:MAG TPA: hypothetical protein VEY50_01050 [Lysobacter sp.]|nr:hypothetical protein [Lysobacter sp.]